MNVGGCLPRSRSIARGHHGLGGKPSGRPASSVTAGHGLADSVFDEHFFSLRLGDGSNQTTKSRNSFSLLVGSEGSSSGSALSFGIGESCGIVALVLELS